MQKKLFALIAMLTMATAAQAQTVRFVCTNDAGAPDRIEVNFDRKTVLEFYQDGPGAPVTPEDSSAAANISQSLISWPDTLDGTTYSLRRSTGVVQKIFEGAPLYTKQCKQLLPGAGWQ